MRAVYSTPEIGRPYARRAAIARDSSARISKPLEAAPHAYPDPQAPLLCRANVTWWRGSRMYTDIDAHAAQSPNLW